MHPAFSADMSLDTGGGPVVGAVLNLIDFPVHLDVKPEVLGLRAWASVGPLRAQLCFPRLGSGSESKGFEELLDAPKVKGIDFLVRLHTRGLEPGEQGVHWGDPWMWREGRVEVAAVNHAVLRIPVEGRVTRDIAERIGNEMRQPFRQWFVLFLCWTEVLTGQDLNDRDPFPSIRSDALGVTHAWVADEGSPRAYTYVNPRFEMLTGSEELALTKPQLRWAMAAANVLAPVPAERLLIRDARRFLRRGDYRGTVLGAATAVEVTLTSELQRALSRAHPDPVVKELLKRMWQFPSRLAVARRMGIRLPDDLNEIVMRPRNTTVHQNLPVTRGQASAALDVASKVVDAHVPLPRLG